MNVVLIYSFCLVIRMSRNDCLQNPQVKHLHVAWSCFLNDLQTLILVAFMSLELVFSKPRRICFQSVSNLKTQEAFCPFSLELKTSISPVSWVMAGQM